MALESLAQAMARLETRGFRQTLRACAGALRVVATDARLSPESLRVEEIVRFEGESDPAEEVVLFALRGPDGAPLGTYTAMFGPATPPEDVEIVRRLRSGEAVDMRSHAGRC
jgi:hypothetical protein